MDDEIQKPEPKISLVVGIFGLIVCIIMDALSFIPGVGDIEDAPAIVVLILSAVFGAGSAVIGIQVAVDILKAIPVVQGLPLWTPAWLFIWWLENSNSRIAQVGQQALADAAIAEGDVEELGEAGAEAAEGAEAATEAGEAGATTTQSGEATATGKGKPSEEAGEETEEGENPDEADKDKDGDIELGDEVDPEEQAQGQDFDLPDNMEAQDDDAEEDEEDLPKAA